MAERGEGREVIGILTNALCEDTQTAGTSAGQSALHHLAQRRANAFKTYGTTQFLRVKIFDHDCFNNWIDSFDLDF